MRKITQSQPGTQSQPAAQSQPGTKRNQTVFNYEIKHGIHEGEEATLLVLKSKNGSEKTITGIPLRTMNELEAVGEMMFFIETQECTGDIIRVENGLLISEWEVE